MAAVAEPHPLSLCGLGLEVSGVINSIKQGSQPAAVQHQVLLTNGLLLDLYKEISRRATGLHGREVLLNGVLQALGYITAPDPVWIKLAASLDANQGEWYHGVAVSQFLKRRRDDVHQPGTAAPVPCTGRQLALIDDPTVTKPEFEVNELQSKELIFLKQ